MDISSIVSIKEKVKKSNQQLGDAVGILHEICERNFLDVEYVKRQMEREDYYYVYELKQFIHISILGDMDR